MTEPTPGVHCPTCKGPAVIEPAPAAPRSHVQNRCLNEACRNTSVPYPKPRPEKQPKTTRPTRHRAAVLPARKPWWLDRDEREEAFA